MASRRYMSYTYGPRQAKRCLRACAEWINSWSSRSCAVSSGYLLSTAPVYSIHWFCLRTAKALIRLRGLADWTGPFLSACARRHVFAWDMDANHKAFFADYVWYCRIYRRTIIRYGTGRHVSSLFACGITTFLMIWFNYGGLCREIW